MAASVRHIKNKAIAEREAEKKEREKAKAEQAAEQWFARSNNNIPTPAEGNVAAAASEEPAAAEVEVEVEPVTSEGSGFFNGPTGTGFWKYQPQMKAFYEGNRAQIFVAALIMLNFLANIIEKEIDPQDLHGRAISEPSVWRVLEHSFNAVFLIELLVNMYARWLRRFWCDGWNIFDFVVVCVGVVSFTRELDGPLKLLRTLRALRVLKLFKRIKSLNKILVMVASAIPGVASALAVLVISISIFALIAVEFFSTFGTTPTSDLYIDNSLTGSDPVSPWAAAADLYPSAARSLLNTSYTSKPPDCSYVNVNVGVVGSVTSREMCFGAEYFGTFTRAWYTLFQILTGESWSEAIARPILFGWNDYGPISIYLSAVYFILFVLINAFILFNVFVAVLLDKVVAPDEPAEEDDIAEESSPEGITLYPWAHNAFFPPANAPATASEFSSAAGAAQAAAALRQSMGPKPSPAAMMEMLNSQLSIMLREQVKREEEAKELREMLSTVLDRLDKLETKS